MVNLKVSLQTQEQNTIYGLWKNSNDKTISADISALSEQYYSMVSLPAGSVLPFYILSQNYMEESRNFELFIGGTIEKDGLTSFLLPAGAYAKITIKPRLGFMWGPAIGRAKRYFYRKWLPKSSYQALNMEYELHTEKSLHIHPSIDLLFAVKRKGQA